MTLTVSLENLRLRTASLACLQLAFCALVNPPVRAGVAHVAVPQDERCVRLDHLESVFAFARFCHLCDFSVLSFLPSRQSMWISS